jgi:hypothetical protein
MDACCAVPQNWCQRDQGRCYDVTSSANWLFGLWPGPAERFDPQPGGNPNANGRFDYQNVVSNGTGWPAWGCNDDCDLIIDHDGGGYCDQGHTFRGKHEEICGSTRGWGATAIEVWRPRP